MESIARTNFLPDRITLHPDPHVRDRGVFPATEIHHPDQGIIRIGYQLNAAGNCTRRGDTDRNPDGLYRAVFRFESRPTLRLVGALPLADLWYDDMAASKSLGDLQAFDDDNALELLEGTVRDEKARKHVLKSSTVVYYELSKEELEAAGKDKPKGRWKLSESRDKPKLIDPACLVLNFTVEQPVTDLGAIASNAPNMEAVMLIDTSNRVVANLGGRSLPVLDVKDILPVLGRNQEEALLKAVSTVAGKPGVDRSSDDIRREREEAVQRALRAGRPLSVNVAGESYVAYFRPLRFAGAWTLESCGGGGTNGDARETSRIAETSKKSDNNRESSSPDSLQGRNDACLLVGLVRAEDVRSRTLELSRDTVMLASLLLLIAILLVPVAKLRYLGPAGDLHPAEVAAAIFGLLAVSALLTLLALFSFDLLRSHARAQASLAATADRLAEDFERERKAILSLPIAATRVASTSHPWVSPHVNLPEGSCRFPDGADTGSGAAKQLSAEYVDLLPSLKEGFRTGAAWPLREVVGLYGPLGRAFPNMPAVANRCHSGARARIDGRPYFRQAMAGEMSGELPGKDYSRKIPGLDISCNYTIGAVRSQADGVAKLAFAIPFDVRDEKQTRNDGQVSLKPCESAPGDAKTASEDGSADAAASGGPKSGVILVTAVSRTLLAPTLPPEQRFVVVDASDPKLVYLFGSDPSRIGIDTLARAIDGRGTAEIRTAFHRTGKTKEGSRSFVADHGGEAHLFAARRLQGTPWVLLVHRPAAGVDTPVAQTALLAAFAWFGLALIAGAALAGVAAFRGNSIWTWLWPVPGSRPRAQAAARCVGLVCLVGLLALILSWVAPCPSLRPWLIWLAVLLPLAAAASAWASLIGRWPSGAEGTKPQKALLPDDERAHMLLLCALLVSLGPLPMAASWSSARHATNMQMIDKEVIHYKRAWNEYGRAIRRQMEVVGLTAISVPEDALLKATRLDAVLPPAWPGAVGLAAKLVPGDPATEVPGGFLGWLAERTGFGSTSLSRTKCKKAKVEKANISVSKGDKTKSSPATADKANPGKSPRANPPAIEPKNEANPSPERFCVASDSASAGKIGLVGPLSLPPVTLNWGVVNWPAAVGVLLGLLALLALLGRNLSGTAQALFGIGVPLEAVEHPRIQRKGGKLDLAGMSVILNGQVGILQELASDGEVLDLGEELSGSRRRTSFPFRQALLQGKTVVVTGLDLALKLPSLRKQALSILEKLSAARNAPGAGRVVVMTDLSPLDRILQAYERELSGEDGKDMSVNRTEQMRWSRLFEDFTTYSLERIPKYEWKKDIPASYWEAHPELHDKWEKLSPSQQEGVRALIGEVQTLPVSIIDSLVGRSLVTLEEWEHWSQSEYPVSTKDLQSKILDPVLAWALDVAPASREAAIDFLRGHLIEHYQHLWAASSHAERILLDSLAHGRVVNIKAALAMRSLIRRGLVRLDPAPQLVNQSFRAFVQQAERPEAIAEWRRELPRGLWDRASRLIAILVPVAILVLVGLGWAAGVGLDRLMPLILGVGPAMFAVGSGLRRA
ncbi:hypothetical protein L6Q21_01140 [Sandaracinobacter sp. RS1-74]|uniref:hypothetical protein n=1 Tax=Sandaracinobacteroides sayramensis TaxID=2913411 RepID=UPI001EDA3671|nr:hypothetical protein [Sandaracinobacteroides sayramensis]MCG2839582.1 hypothetical protein [Sandaracinobacteroides sayramensis]